MNYQSILRGFLAALCLIVLFFGFCFLWLITPFVINADLSIVILAFVIIIPLLAGGVAGAFADKNGMLNGFMAGLFSWLFCMLVIIWFIPQIYSLPVIIISFVVFAFLGMAAGLSGVNMRRVRRELKYGKKEPKPKASRLYKTRYRRFGKFNKL